MYVVENFLYKLLPEGTVRRCRLTTALTDKGEISLVLEALDSKHSKRCSLAARELVEIVNKPPKVLAEETIVTKLGVAAEGKKVGKHVLNTVKTAAKKSSKGAKVNTEEGKEKPEQKDEKEEKAMPKEEISGSAAQVASITLLVLTVSISLLIL